MKHSPSIRHIWQTEPEETQPTCYDARNPAMPWLRARELGFDDSEDRADASAWLCGGSPAVSIGALQKHSASPKASPAGDTPIPDLFQLPIIEQLARKAHTRQN